MSKISEQELPVESRLEEILQTLEAQKRLVLSAEPGAGKSTLVPKALMQSLKGKVLVLEPRRVAARLLAQYVSQLAGTALGDKVGYHVRFDRKTTDSTQLIYLTEGLLRRYIQSDPFLTCVDAVVIDEFHERSVNGDVGLMLLKKIQEELRPDLRILVMSATLDGAQVSSYLGGAPVIEVPGRGFPVKLGYSQKIQNPFDTNEISAKVLAALRMLFDDASDDAGHVLVFLPGQREIRAVESAILAEAKSLEQSSKQKIEVLPLYSQLPEAEIRRALAPRKDLRKILLATNIAESSLTLEGLTSVIDSGLQRRSNVSSAHLVPYLETTRISRASAEQRAGRAGRQAPGRAIRLWTESENRFLEAFETPEIQRSDPSQEILSLLDVGFESVAALPWIDAPHADVLTTVLHKLRTLDLVVRTEDSSHERLSPLAQKVIETPLELRWSLFIEHLLADAGYVDEFSLLAACTPELAPRDREGDLDFIVESKAHLLRNTASYRSLKSALGNKYKPLEKISAECVQACLLRSFLDRLARVRTSSEADKAIMWGSRGLRLPARARDEIHREDFLVAFDIEDSQRLNEDSRLRVFRWASRKSVEALFAARIEERSWSESDPKTGILKFFRAKHLDDFAIQDPIPTAPDAGALKAHRIREISAAWTELTNSESPLGQQLRRLKLWERSPSPEQVREILEALSKIPESPSMAAQSEDFIQALRSLHTYAELQDFETRFPQHFSMPRGRRKELDYRSDGRVFLSTRLADFLGIKTHPSINRGALKLHLEMLSPAARPLQITQDLPNFWKTSYLEIRKELKARYPRQPWPEDPANHE